MNSSMSIKRNISVNRNFTHPSLKYTVELNTLKWGHLCIQWNSSIPRPWNVDTSVYSETPLFQHPVMRTPLYTVELLYSNTLKCGHLCIQWNSSIPTPWNEDTSVYSGTHSMYYCIWCRHEILEELRCLEELKHHYNEQLHEQTALLSKINPQSHEVN